MPSINSIRTTLTVRLLLDILGGSFFACRGICVALLHLLKLCLFLVLGCHLFLNVILVTLNF